MSDLEPRSLLEVVAKQEKAKKAAQVESPYVQKVTKGRNLWEIFLGKKSTPEEVSGKIVATPESDDRPQGGRV